MQNATQHAYRIRPVNHVIALVFVALGLGLLGLASSPGLDGDGWLGHLVLGATGLISLLAGWLGVWLPARHALRMLREGRRAVVEVVDVRRAPGHALLVLTTGDIHGFDPMGRYLVTVGLDTPCGSVLLRRAFSLPGRKAPPAVGDRVAIYYLPERPARFELESLLEGRGLETLSAGEREGAVEQA